MNRFSAVLLATTLSLLPTLAGADPVGFPNLIFPEDISAPATQGCTSPATLAPACRPAE